MRELELGSLMDGQDTWTLVVLVERTAPKLCRGRISFRSEDRQLDTDAILLEDSEDALMRRAAELPVSTLRQLLHALKEPLRGETWPTNES